MLNAKIHFSKQLCKKLEKEKAAALKLNNMRLFKVSQALLWMAENKAVKEIAEFFSVSLKTVYNWFWKFALDGFKIFGLYRFQGRGRKSNLTSEQKEMLTTMIDKGAEANGFDSAIWNTAMIAELIFAKFGVQYNPRYLCTLLKKLGYSYQKARFVSDRIDEEKYRKQRKEWVEITWPKILKEAKAKKGKIVFVDEVSFAMWGSLAKTWGRKGHQPEVKTKGVRKGLKIFGAIEFKNGEFVYSERIAYSLTKGSFTALKDNGVPAEVLKDLKKIKSQKYDTELAFRNAVADAAGSVMAVKYDALILKCSETTARFNSGSYIDFLEKLLANSSEPIFLVEDGASYHTSKLTREYQSEKKEKGRLYCFPLPTFSPDYNPIEKLWKNTKRDATHLKYFKTFEDLRESVVRAFKKYMENASKIFCVMKKLREYAGVR